MTSHPRLKDIHEQKMYTYVMMLKGSTKIHDFAPHKRSDQLPYALKGHQDTAYLFGLYVFQDRKHFLSYKAIYIDISVYR